jgi:hypothetical protein
VESWSRESTKNSPFAAATLLRNVPMSSRMKSSSDAKKRECRHHLRPLLLHRHHRHHR